MEFEKLKHPFPIVCADEGLGIWWKVHLHPAYIVKDDKLPDWLELVVTQHHDKFNDVVWQAHDKKTGRLYGAKAVGEDREWVVKNIIVHANQFTSEAEYVKKVEAHNAMIASFAEVTEGEAVDMLRTEAVR